MGYDISDRQPMRIAALDDDALQLDLFKQALEAMGHICHTHLTGADLLR